MNGNRTDLVLNGSILKNTTGKHNESSCKIILSNTCMSDNAENTIFGKRVQRSHRYQDGSKCPNGYLYFVSHFGGNIFRIVRTSVTSQP
jgi:hypothetical protein